MEELEIRRQEKQKIGRGPLISEKPVLLDLRKQVEHAIDQGREYLFSIRREETYWCAELESNSTITSEYVFLLQILGLEQTLASRRQKLVKYFLSQQNKDGSWAIASHWDGDISTTAEAYLALRILGLPKSHTDLRRAENYILRNGGLEKIRIFTRIFFAMFGLIPWKAIPAIPPEAILFPVQAPIHIYGLSSWARGTMIPLFIIAHHQPVYALPNGKAESNNWLDHLWLNPADKQIPYSSPLIRTLLQHGASFKSFFGATDAFLKLYEHVKSNPLRKLAMERCTQWVLQRQESSGDWAGIFPPMLNGVIALTLQGYTLESEPVKKGIEAIHRFSWEDEDGLRIQACVSPVWDTVLAAIGLIDSKTAPSDPRLSKALQWVLDRQLLVEHGDWKMLKPKLPSGGWSFEYFNSWYPDIDDTAAVLLALLKQDPSCAHSEAVQRAVTWTLGMQNRDGGWAAFDVNNDKLFLNEIPFSDMDSLCDPSSPDVTGRVLEALGLLLEYSPSSEKKIRAACAQGLEYIRKTQEAQGSWFGRWGVNYVYGTSNVLCGLARLRVPGSDVMITPALNWLKHVQNPDGGWGESLASYADKRWMGRGESTASQTAWALMGLLSYLSPEDEQVRRGITWLVNHQKKAEVKIAYEGGKPVPTPRGSSWEESRFTGTGFPNHFYLRYHLYRHYFPMMALGRYLKGFEN